MPTICITTEGESPWLPLLLPCTFERVLQGPNRTDYVLVTVQTPKDRYPDQFVLATRHEGPSLEHLPDTESISVYIIQLKERLQPSTHTFNKDDIHKWQLGAAYGPEAARSSGIPMLGACW